MASIDWTDVTDHAPDLSTVSSDAQTDILAHVNTALVVGEFGGESAGKLKLARVYLAAHFGVSLDIAAAGGSGPVTGQSLGDASISFGAASGVSAGSDLSSTIYGQMFLALVRSSPARAGVLL